MGLCLCRLREVKDLQLSSSWITQMGPNSMGKCLYKRWRKRDRGKGRRNREGEEAAGGRGEAATVHLQDEEHRGRPSTSWGDMEQTLVGVQVAPCGRHLDSGLVASATSHLWSFVRRTLGKE